jgi:hypothetical protein
MRSLKELIISSRKTSSDLTIYATTPWSPVSCAVVASDANGVDLPPEAASINAVYFLEISIIHELINGPLSAVGDEELVNQVIYYATYDSLP